MFGRRRPGRVVCDCFAYGWEAQFFDRSPNVVYIQHYQRRVWPFGNIALPDVTIALNRTGKNAAGTHRLPPVIGEKS